MRLDAAFTNQIGDLDFPAEIPTADPASAYTFAAGPGRKWGYGLLLNTIQVLTLVAQGLVAVPYAEVSLGDLRRAQAETAA